MQYNYLPIYELTDLRSTAMSARTQCEERKHNLKQSKTTMGKNKRKQR